MENLIQDIRYGLRMLAKAPGFTALVVVALALGIGANTAIFSVINSVLLRPLPYKDADRLVMAGLSYPDFLDVKESNQVFEDMAIWASNLYNLSADGDSLQVLGGVVSPNFFAMLGDPLVGRTFTAEEDQDQLAVISYDLWQRRYGGDPAALGKSVVLTGRSHTIIGVMPPEFQFPNSQFKLWVPIGSAMQVAPSQAQNRQLRIFRTVARLKPGLMVSQAQAEVDTISDRLQRQYPSSNAGVRFNFTPLYEQLLGSVRPALLVLLGTVGFVLLIACANVANLMLARTTAREREIAIRTALGAGRWRVARQLLTESVLLSTLGGGLGLLIAAWGIDLLPALDPNNIPRLNLIGIDIQVLLFTFGISVLTGVLFGLAPVLQASRPDLNITLKEGGRGAAGSLRGRRLRSALVVAEVALSLVVLIGAGLLIKSFVRLVNVDPGFIAENLLTTTVEMSRYKEPERRAALSAQLMERIEQIPGVVAAGGGTGLPPQTGQRVTRFEIEGQQPDDAASNAAFFIAVSPNYFRALGTPLLEGRPFDTRDVEGAPKVVIVNQSLARRLFPNESPVGKNLKIVNPEQSAEWRSIVGVVGDVKYSGLDSLEQEAVYTPFAQTPFLWNYVMVRTTGNPAGFASAVKEAVASVNADLTAARILPMEQLVAEAVARPRFNMLLLSVFAALALALAAVGIYGVIAYSVTQRTHEIGIRMALGARAEDVLKMVVKQGMALATAGVATGLVAALAVTRIMESLLFGVSATDPAIFAVISLLLLGVALAASFIPARRATKVDPGVALRYE